jgi:hypothetical protein
MDQRLVLARPDNNGGTTDSPARRGPRPRRWGTSGKCDPVAEAAGFELGLTAKAAEHAMAQAFHRAAVFARHLLAAGADVRLAHYMAELDAVLAGAVDVVSWEQVLELAKAEQAPDGEEDVAQLALVANPTPETRREYLRRADRAMATLQRLRAAVAAQGDA